MQQCVLSDRAWDIRLYPIVVVSNSNDYRERTPEWSGVDREVQFSSILTGSRTTSFRFERENL